MIIAANILIGIVAALHIYFLVLEMFLWTKPLGLKTFGRASRRRTISPCWRPIKACTTAFSPPD